MLHLISTLASYHSADAGYLAGGSLTLTQALEERFLGLGGQVHYNSPVKEVLVEEDFAVGLILEEGKKVRGDLVISAADLHHSVYQLLKGRYNSQLIKESFKTLRTPSVVRLCFGIAADLSGEESALALKLQSPIDAGGVVNDYLNLVNYAFDPTLAPPGKTVVAASLSTDYEYWQAAAKTSLKYEEEKAKLVQTVGKELHKRFPATEGKIEAFDVVTPYSYSRDANLFKGAYRAWVVPPEAGRLKIPARLPGLSDYYQIGQWISPPAGLSGSMLSGRQVIEVLLGAKGKTFSVPAP